MDYFLEWRVTDVQSDRGGSINETRLPETAPYWPLCIQVGSRSLLYVQLHTLLYR